MAQWSNALIKSFYNYGSEGDKADTDKTVYPDWKRIKDRKYISKGKGGWPMAEWSSALIKSFYNYGSQGDKADTEKTVPQTERE